MRMIVIGGSRSGKSRYAEQVMERMTCSKYYLATMAASDEESRERIRRHQAERAGKGYETIECPTDLADAALRTEPGAACLLDCLGNLAANELFRRYPGSGKEAESARRRILEGIRVLTKRASALVIVSNEVNSAGCDYLGDTKEYQKLMGRLHVELCRTSDKVVEMVCGIPVVRRDICGGNPGEETPGYFR